MDNYKQKYKKYKNKLNVQQCETSNLDSNIICVNNGNNNYSAIINIIQDDNNFFNFNNSLNIIVKLYKYFNDILKNCGITEELWDSHNKINIKLKIIFNDNKYNYIIEKKGKCESKIKDKNVITLYKLDENDNCIQSYEPSNINIIINKIYQQLLYVYLYD